jgi:hypothetical protein
MLARLHAVPWIDEALVLSTCNFDLDVTIARPAAGSAGRW